MDQKLPWVRVDQICLKSQWACIEGIGEYDRFLESLERERCWWIGKSQLQKASQTTIWLPNPACIEDSILGAYKTNILNHYQPNWWYLHGISDKDHKELPSHHYRCLHTSLNGWSWWWPIKERKEIITMDEVDSVPNWTWCWPLYCLVFSNVIIWSHPEKLILH